MAKKPGAKKPEKKSAGAGRSSAKPAAKPARARAPAKAAAPRRAATAPPVAPRRAATAPPVAPRRAATAPPVRPGWWSRLIWALDDSGATLHHIDDGELEAPFDAPTLARVTDMNLHGLGSFAGVPFAAMPALRRLTVTYADKGERLASLEGLQAAPLIENLDVSRNAVVDLAPLAPLTALRVLDISDNRIADVGPIAGCRRLETFYASNNPITNVDVLAGMPVLETVWIADTAVRDIMPLARLPRLESVKVPVKLPKDNLQRFRSLRPRLDVSI